MASIQDGGSEVGQEVYVGSQMLPSNCCQQFRFLQTVLALHVNLLHSLHLHPRHPPVVSLLCLRVLVDELHAPPVRLHAGQMLLVQDEVALCIDG